MPGIDRSTPETGWWVNLPIGERLLTRPQLRNSRLKTTITNPNGFTNWLVEVHYNGGGYAANSIFDLDQSGILTTADRIDANIDGDLDDLLDIPMAWARLNGTMSQVTIARIGQGVDTMFLNYLNPVLVYPDLDGCVGDCEGGLAAGHMDLDMDANISTLIDEAGLYDNDVIEHEHEYDEDTGRTYVDYFDIRAGGEVDDMFPIDDVGIDPNAPMIVLTANADLSPAGTLTIGTVDYNVVEYQRIIHEALANWDDETPLEDPDGNSLIVTLNTLHQ